MVIGIIGLVLGIVVMVLGAYSGIEAIPLTLLAGLVVILFNQMPIWDTFATVYAGGFAATVQNYFFIFVSSAVYAKIMESSKATTAIGYKLIDWFGKDRAILVSALFVSVLTYGGVSLFVVIFAAGPIMFLLFKEADLPRHLTMGCLVMGCATYTMTCLPGSPQLTNVIPAQFLGTPMTAAPVLSIVASILMFAMNYGYLVFAEKLARKRDEHWTFPEGYNEAAFTVSSRSELPSAGTSFAPIIALIIIIIAGSRVITNSAMLTTIAMIVAFLLCLILNYKHLKGQSIKKILGTGSINAINAMIGLGAVVGFGTLVSNAPSFQNIVQWVLGVEMSPYFKGIFATGVIAGITGSSSGGVRICLQNMADYFIASGCDLQKLHRLMSIAAGSLDTLPHASGLFLMLSYLGLTHKEGYRHIFVISVLEPLILSIVLAAVCTMIA